MDAKATGGLIARRRKEKNWSQGDLAERLHVTDKAISKWETGRGLPSVDLLEPLAEALGLTVSELLSGRELTAEELPKAAGSRSWRVCGKDESCSGVARRRRWRPWRWREVCTSAITTQLPWRRGILRGWPGRPRTWSVCRMICRRTGRGRTLRFRRSRRKS